LEVIILAVRKYPPTGSKKAFSYRQYYYREIFSLKKTKVFSGRRPCGVRKYFTNDGNLKFLSDDVNINTKKLTCSTGSIELPKGSIES
jgi:hypothetical protein